MSTQPNNPLHGITLENLLHALVEHYGWDGLGRRVAIRCFTHEPSIASSLKFLRRTPWARAQVEALYVDMLDDGAAGPHSAQRGRGGRAGGAFSR
ncbi:VF530 family DNA-binding protein [Thauera butanivorans]|uniref:VF530 family protein n=1 Tax=Thauera butanivorans TaxID=86174 RepID=UPI0008383BBE|nr:VF530 family protein [Thauera butanivorans]